MKQKQSKWGGRGLDIMNRMETHSASNRQQISWELSEIKRMLKSLREKDPNNLFYIDIETWIERGAKLSDKQSAAIVRCYERRFKGANGDSSYGQGS